MRPIEKNTYLNMANCYDNKSATTDDIRRCVQNCAQTTNYVNNVVQNELNQFQDRFQRATRSCEDEVRDRFGDSGDHAAMQKAMLACMSKVVDSHVKMLPNVQANIEKGIDKVK